jgi:hypothetical protein
MHSHFGTLKYDESSEKFAITVSAQKYLEEAKEN